MMVARQVARWRLVVLQQRDYIEELRASGRPTADAEEVLGMFITAQAIIEEHERSLLQQARQSNDVEPRRSRCPSAPMTSASITVGKGGGVHARSIISRRLTNCAHSAARGGHANSIGPQHSGNIAIWLRSKLPVRLGTDKVPPDRAYTAGSNGEMPRKRSTTSPIVHELACC
jgi:hypothetical protein